MGSPSDGGMRIEFPDASATNGLWNQNDKKWTQHVFVEELGHSWDFKKGGSRYLNGFDGGPLSHGLVSAVKAKVGGECFTFLACFSYSPGPEPTVDGFSGHAAIAPWKIGEGPSRSLICIRRGNLYLL
jgi:hypothetical protein